MLYGVTVYEPSTFAETASVLCDKSSDTETPFIDFSADATLESVSSVASVTMIVVLLAVIEVAVSASSATVTVYVFSSLPPPYFANTPYIRTLFPETVTVPCAVSVAFELVSVPVIVPSMSPLV